MTHLELLESEAIYILREVVHTQRNPVLLFSGGKDSMVVLHLLKKAFYPLTISIPIMHIDTGHNFPETIEFRDRIAKTYGVKLIVRKVQDSIDQGRVTEERGTIVSRNKAQSTTLMDALKELEIDAAIGGARRDEEKARAKERFFSLRALHSGWKPSQQRPELWNLYNTLKNDGDHFRVFPISNWTEMDVWQYIQNENLEIPTLYFSHVRNMIRKDGVWLTNCSYIEKEANDFIQDIAVRFRTIGDMTCTGGFESSASSISEIMEENRLSCTTERGVRVDDQFSRSAMEDRKRDGYF